jgi:hypothetical protein
MITKGLFLVAVLTIAAACGGRPLPPTDGNLPDSSLLDSNPPQVDATHPSMPDAVTRRDGCELPAGYCRPGANTCPPGLFCKGCYACKGKAYWECGCADIVPCPICSLCIGKCEPKATSICSTNSDCSLGDYCERDGLCVVTGAAAGQCKPRPSLKSCPVYKQCPNVCGCDGKTYCDPCYAHAAGVSVATKSACFAPTCTGLEVPYAAAIKKAKQCCPLCAALQCYTKVPGKLYCGCETMVNINASGLQAVREEWLARGCQFGLPPCAVKCASPLPGSCQGTSGTSGTCVDGK